MIVIEIYESIDRDPKICHFMTETRLEKVLTIFTKRYQIKVGDNIVNELG